MLRAHAELVSIFCSSFAFHSVNGFDCQESAAQRQQAQRPKAKTTAAIFLIKSKFRRVVSFAASHDQILAAFDPMSTG